MSLVVRKLHGTRLFTAEILYINPEAELVTGRHAEFYADARFAGKLFRVTYYPCAIPSDNQDDKVFGEVYRLKNPEFILAKLDDYEECSEKYPNPKEYIREIGVVHTDSGERIDAWIYLYNRPVIDFLEIVSGIFLKIMCRWVCYAPPELC
ncbi:MAG: gamma-glutamylcyclotransferase family protein [Gallionella sp.]|jgi:gamma-glutamylcyclotransferase (GGCT)/AIG2-like uncharacterized protein YtfP